MTIGGGLTLLQNAGPALKNKITKLIETWEL